MKIGYACTPLGVPYKTTRKFLLKNLSDEVLIKTISNNLEDLNKILIYNKNNNIDLFRISSDIIPFGNHEDNKFNWNSYFREDLDKIAALIKTLNIRLSMHPGQYTLINSPNFDIVKKSFLDLEYHEKFLESLGTDKKSKIILHVGGVYDDKEKSINRFINNYNSLDSKIKDRLVIENDDKSYGLNDVLKISDKCNIPVVFDNLHYECLEDSPPNTAEILNNIHKTWSDSDGTLKVHYSEQSKFKQRGSHSQTINASNFIKYKKEIDTLNFDIDIMTEVKDKDFSAIKISNIINPTEESLNKELQRYELFLREKGDDIFNNALSHASKSILDFYIYLDSIFFSEVSEFNFKNTLEIAFKNMEPTLNAKEINHYKKYIKNNDFIKAKNYLINLINKKGNEEFLAQYYFHAF